MITMAQWTRGGESLLKQIDFLEGIAPNSKAYITQALEILAHRDLRKAAAQNFRARMRKSAICHPSKMSQGIVQHAKQLLASLD